MESKRRLRGFTLIELLIVIAIILILIAIALPNFLEAQIRAKVTRVEAEMRSIATAIESYQTDYQQYPPDEVWVDRNIIPRPAANQRSIAALSVLTTPIAYMTEILPNQFPSSTDQQAETPAYFRYMAEDWIEAVQQGPPVNGAHEKHLWSLASAGPDGISNIGEYLIFGTVILEQVQGLGTFYGDGAVYSPTNGTKSGGDIVRVGP